MTRLRSSTFVLPPSPFGLRRTSRATAHTSRFGEARSATRLRPGGVRALATAAVVIGGGSSVVACPLCFGAEETSMIDGAQLGVLVMLAVLFAVQGGFVGFFLYLRKRAKRIADIELDAEWAELQGAPRTS